MFFCKLQNYNNLKCKKKLVKLSSNEQHMNYDDFFCNLEIASIIHLKELQLS